MERNITLEQTEELYQWLQGEEDSRLTVREQPKLTPNEAFAVIYYLQEIMQVIPDVFEQDEENNRLYDSDAEDVE